MKVSVFQLNRKQFRFLPDYDVFLMKVFILKHFIKERNYEWVADVEVNELSDVFRVTNHITESWTLNKEIIEATENNVRSTSVGDVYYNFEDENYYYVAPFGLESLGKL